MHKDVRVTGAVIDYDLLDTYIAPIARQRVEICVMLYTNTRNQPVGLRHIRGTRSGIEVPFRLFVADALAFDAHGAIMAHNHPSGDPMASRTDIAVTGRLARVFDAVGVTLIDHLVIAGAQRTSLRQIGYL